MDPIATTISNVEAVRWAYRFVLGREAESEAVLEHWAALGDGRLILSAFVRSPEAIAHLGIGAPAHGRWSLAPLDATAIRAAYYLRFNAAATDAQIRAELAAHPDMRSFRRAFLAMPELSELAQDGAAPEKPRRAVLREEHKLTVLDRSFTLRGDSPEGYWTDLVNGPNDPSLERLTRLLRAAFPDGGAGRVLADVGANIGVTSLAIGAAAPYHAELLAFEPDQRSLPLLRHNLATNDFPHARILDLSLIHI